MPDYVSHLLLNTKTVSVSDVVCPGTCRHKSDEECLSSTHLVLPYRGAYVHHLGQTETVAQPNQAIFFNGGEPYSVSHPVEGGDACLSLWVEEEALLELAPDSALRVKGQTRVGRFRQRIDPSTQALIAHLRHGLTRGAIEKLEAETLALDVLSQVLESKKQTSAGSAGRRKLVNRAKLVLSSEPARRWSLSEIASAVGVSSVYLAQAFQQTEAISIYRYQLQMRLAKALDLLPDSDDLTRLALDLGFSSHSHFSAAFRRVYAQTPSDFQRTTRAR